MDVINYDPNEALENLFNNRTIDFDVGCVNDVIVISDDEDGQSTDNIITISDDEDESQNTQEEVNNFYLKHQEV